MTNLRFAGLLALCTLLAGCDRPTTPSRDLGAPESRPNFLAAEASLLERYAGRADQASPVFSAEELLANVSALGPSASENNSGTTECVGTLVGPFERIEVPPGATCILVSAIVSEWVHALEHSELFVFSSEIGGNVMGMTADAVQLIATHVAGNVHISKAGDPVWASCYIVGGSRVDGNYHCIQGNPAAPRIEGPNTFGGSVDVTQNVSPPNFFFNVIRNTVEGTVQVSNNEGLNFKRVQLNTIAKTLNCRNNDPVFVGGPNVAKNANGQCF